MFERIGNSWRLIKASAAVLWADKELILFPIISAIGVLIVTVTFAFPMILANFFDALLDGKASGLGFIVGFLFYTVQYFVIIFANSALVGAAMIRLRGGDPTVRDGFRIAWEHVTAILGYALISATVGMILRWLSERGKVGGRIAASLLGLGWNLATYLVVPVLVVEGVGPLEGIKRSADLLKRTWGEQIVGNFSVGTVFGLLTVAVIVLSIPIFVLVASADSLALIILTALGLVLTLVLIGLINSTLNGIYIAAVYQYAAEGETGGFFQPELIEGAFRPE
ncbi:MAG TPA: hypothetical protein ENN99_01100 [Chloroflexi bacterium]|nr:hypothetical protein [Chloroflexota bacterium]